MIDFSERVRQASTRRAQETEHAAQADQAQAEADRLHARDGAARLGTLDETLDVIADAIAEAGLAERARADVQLLSEFGHETLAELPPVRSDPFSGPPMFGIPGFFRTRQRRAVCEDHCVSAWALTLREGPTPVRARVGGLHLTAFGALAHPDVHPVDEGRLADGRVVHDCSYLDLSEVAAEPAAHELILDALADFVARYGLASRL